MSVNTRLISRLDVKGPNLIKGVHLEGLRVIGDPNEYALRYYNQGVDEIIYMDTVASLYGRNNLHEIVQKTANNVYVPITVGGGIRSIDDVKLLLRCGAEKVAVNTAAVKRPELITEISRKFGSQCMVLSIEAKKKKDGKWEVYTENGRQSTGVDVIEWALEAEKREAGEVLLTSVDNEGTKKGFDYDLIEKITNILSIPVIVSGGMGELSHLEVASEVCKLDAVAMADVLHYDRLTIGQIREFCVSKNISVREYVK